MQKTYIQNKKVIQESAKSISRKTGIEWEELECQGNLIFVECFDSFDSSKGVDFDVYFKKILYFQLFDYCNVLRSQRGEYKEFRREKIKTTANIDIETIDLLKDEKQIDLERREILKDNLQQLSNDSKKIVDSILKGFYSEEREQIKKALPRDTVRLKKKWIVKKFREEQNWSIRKIQNCFSEITSILQEA